MTLNIRDTRPLDHELESLPMRIRRVAGAGLIGGFAVTALGLVAHEVAEGSAFEVHEVEVTGNVRVSDVAIRHLSDLRVGTHLASVDLERAVMGVRAHPWIRHAEARLQFPSGVQLVVTEHEPKMLLALESLWYVASDGTIFREADGAELDYPILSGLSSELTDASPAVAASVVAHAINILDSTDGHAHLDPDRVSEVLFDSHAGFSLVLRSGTTVVLGFDDVEARIERFDLLVSAGFDPQTPQLVDLGGSRVAVATPLDRESTPPPAG